MCVLAGGSVAVATPAAAATPVITTAAADRPISLRLFDANGSRAARALSRPRGLQVNPFIAHPSTTALTADKTAVKSGLLVTLTGSVAFGTGLKVRDQLVTLQVKRGSTWDSVTTSRLSADGAVAFTVRPTSGHTYRLSYPGTAGLTPSTSADIGVTVASPVTTTTTTRSSSSSSSRAYSTITAGTGVGGQVVALAAAETGKPYVYAAAGPNSFDCSGLTQWVFAKVGVSLPHNADAQKSYGVGVSSSAALPGDLVVFLSGGYGYHVAIYAGNGYMYDAPHSGSTVGLHQIYSGDVIFRRLV